MPSQAPPESAAQAEPSDDDPNIPNDDNLYRRLSDSSPNMVAVDAATGERRPSSGAFKPDEDGVSVFREAKLHEAGLVAADVVKNPLNLVVSVAAGEVRSVRPLGVRDDAWPADIDEPEHPRNVAHALILGWNGLSRGQRRQRQQALTKLPSIGFIYP